MKNRHPKSSSHEGKITAPTKPPSIIELTIYAISIFAFAGLCYWFFSQQEMTVKVECTEIKGGMDCSITQSLDTARNVDICWEISRICENGLKSSAKKCQFALLEPGIPSKSAVALSEFSNNENCHKVSTVVIENLEATPAWRSRRDR